jgi:hypothetical protein
VVVVGINIELPRKTPSSLMCLVQRQLAPSSLERKV